MFQFDHVTAIIALKRTIHELHSCVFRSKMFGYILIYNRYIINLVYLYNTTDVLRLSRINRWLSRHRKSLKIVYLMRTSAVIYLN